MKKFLLVGMIIMGLTMSACNKSNEELLKEAPSYISDSWNYYEQMSSTIEAIEGGENIEVAFDKYFSMENELKEYIDNKNIGGNNTEEEKLVIDNLYFMYLKLSTMYIENFNAFIGEGSVDIENHLYELQVPQHELEKIYGEYDLELAK